MKYDYDSDTGLMYCARIDAWFELDTEVERTSEQKRKAAIMFKEKQEMEDLQDDSDFLESPEIWSGRNYGTADHPKYLTPAGNNYF